MRMVVRSQAVNTINIVSCTWALALTKKPALTQLAQKRPQRIARLVDGNNAIQVAAIAFQGFKRQVGAVSLNQLGGAAHALGREDEVRYIA